MTTKTVLLYDADCGFCRWSLDKILRWDRNDGLRPVPLQAAEADLLLNGMEEERKMASWHLVTPDGRVYSAGDAVPPLARLLKWGGPVAAIAGAVPGLTNRLYRLVAGNRDKLGGMIGSKACAVDPSRSVKR